MLFSIEAAAEDCKLVSEVTGCFGLELQGNGEGSMSEDRAANIDASRA